MENKYSSKDFQKYYWYTAYQLRDMLMEEFLLTRNTEDDTTNTLRLIKNLAAEEQARRKSLPLEYVECPYCKCHHGEINNNDKLCEKCEWTVHILNWKSPTNEN
jgi:hypothetical protein